MAYAENTSVSAEKSRSEIERTLRRYGASGFMYGWVDGKEDEEAMIRFKLNARHIAFRLKVPSQHDKKFKLTERGRARSESQAYSAWEQAVRQKWRALALVIKAKLEAVESGITSIEDEFLAHIEMANGLTIGQYVIPKLEALYKCGNIPALLPDLRGDHE